MENLIKRTEKTPVSLGWLKKHAPKNTQVVLYENLNKDFPKNIDHKIVLLEAKTESIGHFVVILNKGSSYFSSYGHRPGYALKITKNNPAKMFACLKKNYRFNSFRYQVQQSTETCGMWCLVRCIFDQNASKFKALFGSRVYL